MKHLLFLSSLFVCLSGMISCPLYAQQTESLEKIDQVQLLSTGEWSTTVEDAKKEVKALMQENDRLTSEYAFLKEKLSALQSEVLAAKEQVQDKEQGNLALEQFRKDQARIQEKIQKDMDGIKKNIAEIENEKNILLKQLKEEEQQTEMWQSQLSDLQVKKRELTLELKLQEISRQELEQGEDEELEKLKDDLAKYQAQEKVLDQELRALNAEASKIPPQIDSILLENKDLQARLEKARMQQEQQARLNEDLAAQNTRLEQEAGSLPKDLIKEQEFLDAEVRRLEIELDRVKASVENSAALIQKKRQLMDEIIRMDEENQKMRKEIESLQTGENGSQPQVLP